MIPPPAAAKSLDELTLGHGVSLEDLIDRDALDEMVKSFHDLFGVKNSAESKPNFLFKSCSASSALQVKWRSPIMLSTTPMPRVATARYTGSRPLAASSAISASLRTSGKSRLLN